MAEKIKADIQLEAKYYFTKGYCTPKRFSSYSHQFSEVLDSGAESVLEIGPGCGVVTYLLKKAGLVVDTLDHDCELSPNIVGSVLNVPVMDESYDAVLCCQVLEHLPWREFLVAMKELRRVAKKTIIISLPHISKKYYVDIKLPKIGRKLWVKEIELNRAVEKNSEHYWEIGRGVSEKDVSVLLGSLGLKILKSYRSVDFEYHHFYVVNK